MDDSEVPKIFVINQQKNLKSWPLILRVIQILQSQSVNENIEIEDLGTKIINVMRDEFNISFGDVNVEPTDNFKIIELKDILEFLENCPESLEVKMMKLICGLKLEPIFLSYDNHIIYDLKKFKEKNYDESLLDVNFYEGIYSIIFNQNIVSQKKMKNFMNFLHSKGWPVKLMLK